MFALISFVIRVPLVVTKGSPQGTQKITGNWNPGFRSGYCPPLTAGTMEISELLVTRVVSPPV